ncbi:trypsin-4-like [Cotesia glomerata]|uniref:trypsin-4-like n=1 Tax=Cotesia glomerata TaxID=32391 RepID=UPI001D022EE8|nr:trypsin-4-like [Cotesia glomerata]
MENTLLLCLLITLISESHLIVVTHENESNSAESDDIEIEIAPFALSLRLNNNHICGATIINSKWGMTAAHCVKSSIASVQNYTVRSGSKYRETGGSIHQLTEIVSHENYSSLDSDYDVAVFQVEPKFKFSSLSQPITLPEDDADVTWGAAIGWGGFDVQFENVLSDTLRMVLLPKVNWDECVADYINIFTVTPRQLCYGYKEGGRDTCKGDSGGPLFNRDKILIGITSWGDDCAQSNSPGIYTDVQLIKDWIDMHTKD